MSKRIDRTWVVLESRENAEGDRCVDLFRRPDGSFGFEEFRRDPEDGGTWTPVAHYAGVRYATKDAALRDAMATVGWLSETMRYRL